MIEVVNAGAHLTVQDQGRPGYAALGVPRSGAIDRTTLALANRLVGNPESFAGLEIVLSCRLRFGAAATVAITGARAPSLRWGEAISMPAGAELAIPPASHGLRYYLAVRGGVDVAPVLGSRSCDSFSGLGPAPLRNGDRLGIGPEPSEPVSAALAIPTPADGEVVLRVLPGPRDDWFSPDAVHILTSTIWRVQPNSDRVGLRLAGPSLTRTTLGELPSEPMLPGALQVPPSGQPILFGPDSPVTGGYPVIAVVGEDDLGRTAQLRPGDGLRFTL